MMNLLVENLPEKFVIALYIRGLSDKVSILLSANAANLIDLKTAQHIALNVDAQQNQLHSGPHGFQSMNSALITRDFKKEISKVKCFKCGNHGHYANKCTKRVDTKMDS
ncbi:hypothetical protein HMI54_012642, partial [Coelomomyces lativittatus]